MTHDLDDLPFLLVHGPAIWKAALLAAVVSVLAAIRLVRDRRARGRARDAAAVLAGGPGAIRGTLRSRDRGVVIATLRAASWRDRTVAVDWRADHVWIETVEGPIWLDGEVRIAAGRSVRGTRGIPRGTPRGLVDDAAERYPWLTRRWRWRGGARWVVVNMVRAGVEVVAAGEVQHRPGAGETDYRTAKVTRWLRGSRGRPVVLAAAAPRGVARPLARRSVLAIASGVAVAGYVALSTVGHAWRAECRGPASVTGGAAAFARHDLADYGCVRAAATPGSHDEVLRGALARLDAETDRDDDTLAQQLALAHEVEGCPGVIRRLEGLERHADLVAVARRCGDRAAERRGLLAQGLFAEAADVPVTVAEPDAAARVLIAAGRWYEAADAASGRAGHLRTDGSGDGNAEARYYDCLAELFRHHAGDPGAAARLAEASEGPDGRMCLAARSETVGRSQRADLLAPDPADPPEYAAVLARLRFANGLARAPADGAVPAAVIAGLDAAFASRDADLAWLAIAAEDAAYADPAVDFAEYTPWDLVGWNGAAAARHGPVYRDVLRWLAVHEIVLGGEVDARSYVYEAGDVPAGPVARPAVLDAIELYFAVRPDPPGVPGAFDRVTLRNGRIDTPAATFMPGYRDALGAALGGDGLPLARLVGDRSWPRWTDGDVMAVLPWIDDHRDELARALVGSAPRDEDWLGRDFPFGQVLHAAARRSVLAMAGAEADAGRWHGIVARYEGVLADRDRLIALVLWPR